ncbi:heterochromatin protein 1-like [Sitodiplosis mosellana]|uniref:heterochromatin protein 1-like n=1 Tax=Sitodiplosis mosellana TaxID=263140 RepID=UPI00244415BE|nr:heterochromatin protein 1-like [Sitodiplosis mosellana]
MVRKQAVKLVSSECYAIEKVLDSRLNGESKREYLIKWKDFPESENSWQSVDDLFSKQKAEPEITRDTAQDAVIQATPSRKRKSSTPLKAPIASTPQRTQNDASAEQPTPEKSITRARKRMRQIDEISEAAAEQPTKKRMRKSVPQSASPVANSPKTRKTSKPPLKTVTNKKEEEETKEMDRIQSLRKREGRHEYLVKWKNSDEEEWIGRDVMVTKYAENVIAFFQSIVVFK